MADYTNSKFVITILTPVIFKLKIVEGVEIDVDDVREMRSVYLKFSGNKPFAILLDAAQPSTQTQEARILLASKEFSEKRIAAGFVTRSLASKLIGNFFIQFHKPASPTRLFNDESEAFNWLQKQVERHNSKFVSSAKS
jgi:hypothetical protein